MISLITLRFLKNFKWLINLLIKFIKTFSFILIFKKYYSHFKVIFNYLKNFKHYYIFKFFIKSLAILNILMGGYTIFILTDLANHDYLLKSLNESDLFIKIKIYINRIIKFFSDLFLGNDNIKEDTFHDNSNPLLLQGPTEKGGDNFSPEGKLYKNFLYLIAFTTISLGIYFIVHNNYIDLNLFNYISNWANYFRGGDDTGTSDSNGTSADINKTIPSVGPCKSKGDIINKDKTPSITITDTDNKTFQINISSSNVTDNKTSPTHRVIYYSKETGEAAEILKNRLNEILKK